MNPFKYFQLKRTEKEIIKLNQKLTVKYGPGPYSLEQIRVTSRELKLSDENMEVFEIIFKQEYKSYKHTLFIKSFTPLTQAAEGGCGGGDLGDGGD